MGKDKRLNGEIKVFQYLNGDLQYSWSLTDTKGKTVRYGPSFITLDDCVTDFNNTAMPLIKESAAPC